MDQGEDRISGLEFKVEELDHSSKEHEKIIKKHMKGVCRKFRTPKKKKKRTNI